MDRKNLLIASGLIGAVIVLISIGIFISSNSASTNNSIPSLMNLHDFNSTDYSNLRDDLNSTDQNLTDDNSNSYPVEELYVTFDNSTPEATAKSIARLNEGLTGFYTHHKLNASLTSDRKYWIVNMDDWVVTVDAKTLMSKKDGGYWGPKNKWRSFDELKAKYIAEIQSKANELVGEPTKVTIDGKEIWKVPVYDESFDGQETYFWEKPVGHVYVDVATGKSKKLHSDLLYEFYSYIFNDAPGKDGWKTFKEVDDIVNIIKGYPDPPQPFKDALGDLYS